MIRDVMSNKISYPEYTALVRTGAITPAMVEEQIWWDFDFTMDVQNNCINLKPVAMSGSYNDLTDKPEIPTPVTVINALDSTSETDALSAYQGNLLNQDISTISENLSTLSDAYTKLDNSYTTLNDAYTSLSSDVSTLSNEVNTLSSDVKTLTSKVDEIPIIDVINNLTSSSTTSALSAAQGQILNESIKTNSESISTNAENIKTNTQSIEKNASDIKTNSDAISTLQSDVTTLKGQVPTGTKIYLHQIRVSVVNASRNKTAMLYIDYYSTQSTPYTSVGFAEIEYDAPHRCGGFYIDMTSSSESKAAWQVSIIPFNGTYAFIVNGSNGVEVDADLQVSTISDNVVGYLFA